nr:ribonuclease H-like domain-containing protein [Tanacetum cinerariifolium]
MLELVKICQEKEFLCIHDDVDDLIESALNSKLLLINSNSQHLDKKEQEVKNVVEQPVERGNRSIQSLHNFRVVHKNFIALNTSQISSIHAVAPVLSTKEPEHSLSMGYKHLSITPETKSDEVTESNAENLLPIPSESEEENGIEAENVVQQEEEEIDLEDISQIQDVVLREKLLSITRLISNIESLNDNPTPDRMLNSFASDNSLLDNFSPNSKLFAIIRKKREVERLINLVKNDNPDDSSNDSLLEEADLFLFDNSIPPGIENVADDPEGDIRFLEELLIDDFILSYESSDSNFEDNSSIPRPPPEPPDTETNTGEEIPVMMIDKDKFDYDYHFFMFDKVDKECLDSGLSTISSLVKLSSELIHGILNFSGSQLVQNRYSFYGLRSEDPNQHLKDFLKLVDSLDLDNENKERTGLRLFQFSLHDQASNWLERLPAGSFTIWEDLTTRFLPQFFPPGRTEKLRNDIQMFQQHQRESLSEAWTLNKIPTSCEISSGPHDTQYCMEDPRQAFVEYASSRTDEARASSKSRPPMLNKENYVPWSSRLLRQMIAEPGDGERDVNVNETFHEQTDDELSEREVKQIEADDQAIQTILLGLPEDIYAAVDKWSRHVTIVHQTKDLNTADYTQLYDFLKYNQKEVDELKAKQIAKIQDPLALMENSNNPYASPAPHPDLSPFNQNYMQQPMPNPEDITDPTTAMNMALALMAKAFKLNYSTPTNNNQRISSNPRNRQIAQLGMNMGQDRQMQMIGGNGGNQFRQYAGQNAGNLNGYNAVQNVRNQVAQNPKVQNIGNQNGLMGVQGNGNLVAVRAEGNAVGHNRNQIRCYNCRGKEEEGIQLQAEEYDIMAAAADLYEIEEVNANCILMAKLQQASSSDTQIDSTLVYDLDCSAEVHEYENCYNNEIFNMFTQEEQYTELLEPIPESHQVPQNNNEVISEVTGVEQSGETVEQHFANFEETRALYDSLYHNLAVEVKKVNSV